MNGQQRGHLEQLIATFAHNKQPLSAKQGQEAIHLLRAVEATLQQIPMLTDDPFMEAPTISPYISEGQRPALFVDRMRACAQAREQTDILLLMCLAYTPVSRSQELFHQQQRRAITAAMRRLAQTLEKIPAFVPTVPRNTGPIDVYLVVPPET